MALPPPPDLVGDRIHDYGLSGYLRPSSKSGRHRDTALSAERNQSAVYQRTKIREDDTRHRLAGTRLPNRRFPGRRPEIRESFHRGGRDRTATHRDPVGSASIPVIAPTLHASARKRYGESSAPLFLCPKVKNAHTAVDSEISRSIPFSRSDHLLVPTRSPPIFRTRISKSSRETSAQLRTFVR